MSDAPENMSTNDLDAALDHLGTDRRTFLRKLAIGTAVVAPVVTSFSMSGMQAAYAQSVGASGATTTTTSTTTTTLAPNMSAFCAISGPYGPNQFTYAGNQSPASVRPDLFAPNGLCYSLEPYASNPGQRWWEL
jgi:hypothetical protein